MTHMSIVEPGNILNLIWGKPSFEPSLGGPFNLLHHLYPAIPYGRSKQDGMAIKTPATAIDCRGDWFVSWSWEILQACQGEAVSRDGAILDPLDTPCWGLLFASRPCNNHIKAELVSTFGPKIHFFQRPQSILTCSILKNSSFSDDISAMLVMEAVYHVITSRIAASPYHLHQGTTAHRHQNWV